MRKIAISRYYYLNEKPCLSYNVSYFDGWICVPFSCFGATISNDNVASCSHHISFLDTRTLSMPVIEPNTKYQFLPKRKAVLLWYPVGLGWGRQLSKSLKCLGRRNYEHFSFLVAVAFLALHFVLRTYFTQLGTWHRFVQGMISKLF